MTKKITIDRKKSKTILVVEDSPVQAFAMIKLLEQHGLHVLWALDGSAGVVLAQNSHPDLIILDIQMQGMNGLEACRIIKQDPAFLNIPVIFVTAFIEPEMFKMGMCAGAIDFIPKDVFSDMVLLKTLQELEIITQPGKEPGFFNRFTDRVDASS